MPVVVPGAPPALVVLGPGRHGVKSPSSHSSDGLIPRVSRSGTVLVRRSRPRMDSQPSRRRGRHGVFDLANRLPPDPAGDLDPTRGDG
jgi:hypothetical protein